MNMYNNHCYWENALNSKKELYKKSLKNVTSIENTIFINTVIIDYDRSILDNNWGCYTNVKALLGFIQYVYVPTAFFHILNREYEDIFIPICSSESFLDFIMEAESDYKDFMRNSIEELRGYWDLADMLCLKKVKNFCTRFNTYWNKDNNMLYIDIFLSPTEIAKAIIEKEEFIEVLEEDMGLHKEELLEICRDFYNNTFIQKTFVEFLNYRIGCIV